MYTFKGNQTIAGFFECVKWQICFFDVTCTVCIRRKFCQKYIVTILLVKPYLLHICTAFFKVSELLKRQQTLAIVTGVCEFLGWFLLLCFVVMQVRISNITIT